MRRLLSLLILLFALPAAAGLFDSRPSASLGGINNSADFLPVREAFRLSLVESTPEQITLRFVAAEGYYLYRHRFQFKTGDTEVALGEARMPAGQQKTDDYFGEVEVY
ncbi:protein-disulfide reductase DsbD domain-containing protein, partial [Stutzerimonas nitrititolerans]